LPSSNRNSLKPPKDPIKSRKKDDPSVKINNLVTSPSILNNGKFS